MSNAAMTSVEDDHPFLDDPISISDEGVALWAKVLPRDTFDASAISHGMVMTDQCPVTVYVAGGYLVDAILGRQPRDLDCFFQSEDDFFAAAVWAKSIGLRFIKMSSMSLKLGGFNGIEVDMVRRAWYPSLERVIQSFDFRACQLGWDGEKFLRSRDALEDIDKKIIQLTSTSWRRPTASFMHCGKYIGKGFKMTSQMMFQLGQARRKFEQSGRKEEGWES